MVPSFSFSGPHFERRRAERDPPGTYLKGKTKTTYRKTKVMNKILSKLLFELRCLCTFPSASFCLSASANFLMVAYIKEC